MAAEQSRRRQIAEQRRKQFRRRQIAEQPRKRQIIEQPRSLSGIAQATSLKKLLMIGAAVTGAVTGAALVVKRLASSAGGLDFERLIERMPENAPPKWIFHNVSAIRENTERILQVLEGDRTSAGPEPTRDAAAPSQP
ncbi:MAG TPA: hypothetical protein VF086_07650 [Propionibacteriaceae bacterium]